MNRVRFLPAASEDLAAAAAYLEGQAEGLGQDFLGIVESGCLRLERFPDLARPIGPRLRALAIPRFPFSLVYANQPGLVLIVAVAHHDRRPGYGLDRV